MATYTHGHHESVLRSHRWRTVENSAAYLVPSLRAGLDVLDVGCGPGTITTELGGLVGPAGRVLGIDPAPEVIELARAATSDSAANVEFRVGDIYTNDLPDQSFDIAHAHQVLQHLEDPVRALQEMGRLVRPGGLVAVRDADYAAMTWYPENRGLRDWLDLYEQLARHNGGEPDAGRHLLAWAKAAGYTDVTPSASVWCFATPTDREWWGGLQADRTTQSAFAEQAVAASLASKVDLAAMAVAWRTWERDERSWFAVLHGEIRCRVPV